MPIISHLRGFGCLLAAVWGLATPALAGVDGAALERTAPDAVRLTWTSRAPVDVLEAADRTFDRRTARVLASHLTTGELEVKETGPGRHYYILEDLADHQRLHMAERTLPLEQGSNFRDIGGYVAFGGRNVRWGMIYRSGAQPLLTAADLARIRSLGLSRLVDLRSNEERIIAPSKITGIPTTAVGYGLMDMVKGASSLKNGYELYRNFPTFLAPELKVVFADLLHGDAPVAYNCSAGQDRTGFVTAMILSALGTPREVIVSDYLISMKVRHPEFEMPELNPAEHPNDPVVRMFAGYRSRPNWKTPDRLIDEQDRPFLLGAFAEIEQKWGSVRGYLKAEIGLTDQDLERLRSMYLE